MNSTELLALPPSSLAGHAIKILEATKPDQELLQTLDLVFHQIFYAKLQPTDDDGRAEFLNCLLDVVQSCAARRFPRSSGVPRLLDRWDHLRAVIRGLQNEADADQDLHRFVESRNHGWSILNEAYTGGETGVSHESLRQTLETTAQNLSPLLRKLESHGLIEQRKEGRNKFVVLGAAGRRLLAQANQGRPIDSASMPGRERYLAGLLSLFGSLSATLDIQSVYQKACEAAVTALEVDHSTFFHFDDRLEYGTFKAEYFRPQLPSNWRQPAGTLHRIPLKGVAEEDELIQTKTPLKYNDVARDVRLGVFRDNLMTLGIKSVLIVPVVREGIVLGSFSLDSIMAVREFSDEDINLAMLLATGIAQALQNAQIYEAQKYSTELHQRLESSQVLLSTADSDFLLRRKIVELASALVNWPAGALFTYDAETGRLNPYVRQNLNDNRTDDCELTQEQEKWLYGGPTSDSYSLLTPDDNDGIFDAEPFRGFDRALAIRLKTFGELDSVLLLLDRGLNRKFLQIEIALLTTFISRATSTIEKQEWWSTVWEKLALQFLHLIGPGPQSEHEFEKFLYYFLTMVTAKFGLGFNRAIFFLLNEEQDALQARFAIGHFDEHTWKEACAEDARLETDQFEGWFKLCQSREDVPSTPLNDWIRQQDSISLDDVSRFSELLLQTGEMGKSLSSEEVALNLPAHLREKLRFAPEVILMPLQSGRDLLGVLIVDNAFTTRRAGKRDLLLLNIICRQAAIVIDKYQQQRMQLDSRLTVEHLERFEEDGLLRWILNQTSLIFKAWGCAFALTDRQGRRKTAYSPSLSSLEVMNIHLDDLTQNADSLAAAMPDEPETPVDLRRVGVRAVLRIPLLAGRKGIGTLWMAFREPLGWRRPKTRTLRDFANQVSTVYSSWLRLHEASELEQAAREVSAAISDGDAGQRLVDVAHRIFDARAVTFWPFDVRKQAFLMDRMRRTFTIEELPRPVPGGITYRILQSQGYQAIPNVTLARDQITTDTLAFLERNGLLSLQGVAIRFDQELLGVLYVAYGEPRRLDLAPRWRLENFAASTGMVLQLERELKNSREIHEAALEVSRVLALGNREQTLRSIGEKSLTALRCDVVSIFECEDGGKYAPKFPPMMFGEFDYARVLREDEADAHKLIPALVQKGEVSIARDGDEIAQMKSKFVVAEGIQTAVAAPLAFSGRFVGLMFANFRNELPPSEITPLLGSMGLLANHAASAIGNSQRFEALAGLATDFLNSGDRKAVFQRAAEFIAKQLAADFCVLTLREGGQLRVVGNYGWKHPRYREIVEATSHAGYTETIARHNRFRDLYKIQRDENFHGRFDPPQRMFDEEITSGIGIPIMIGEKVRGAIVVHSRAPREFTDEDASFLSLVSSEVMVAEGSAKRHSLILAQYQAAQVIAQARVREADEPLLRRMLGVICSTFQNEREETKVSGGIIELAQTAGVTFGEPDPEAEYIQEKLVDNGVEIGRIQLRSRRGHAFDDDEREMLRNLAPLTVIAVRQSKEHQQWLLENLETMAIILRKNSTMILGEFHSLYHNDTAPPAAQQQNRLRSVVNRLGEQQGLIENLAYTLRVLTGEQQADIKEVSADRISRELELAVGRFRATAGGRLSLPPELNIVQGGGRAWLDEKLLGSVLDNAIANRLRAGTSVVTCGLKRADTDLLVEIATVTGNGPEREISEMTGFGMGLSFSSKIMEMFKGSLLAGRNSVAARLPVRWN